MSEYTLLLGDCLEVMRATPSNSYETTITDPPYGLGFMGRDWDKGVPGLAFWKEMLRVAKPGATLLAFGGTRMFHRMMVAIEDAGWELRDTLMWLYGTGFPKGLDLGKSTKQDEWNGWRTQLKPAYEPIIVAQKPLDGTYAQNAIKWGVAGYAIDDARLYRSPSDVSGWASTGSKESENRSMSGKNYERPPKPDSTGRYPTNVIIDEEVGTMIDEQSGISKSGNGTIKRAGGFARKLEGRTDKPEVIPDGQGHGDSGGASRFFYCAKASRSERGDFNTHETVKPIALMRYLARLTKTPTGGCVFDPFMGSGSTGVACIMEGREFVGIEKEEKYYEIAKQRLSIFDKEAADGA